MRRRYSALSLVSRQSLTLPNTLVKMYRTSALIYILSVISINPFVCLDEIPAGNLKPFGRHREPDVVTEEITEVPHPAEFWETYVSKNKPVVFRGAAKNSRAYELWTEEFLSSEYGDLTVRLEARAEANDRVPVGSAGILGRDTIKHFIQNYQTMDAYVISQIPQPMEKDIGIPPCLRCGSFSEAIQEVHLFLSARGGKTKLHQDPYSNIHCIFNGTKDWILVHPDQTNLVYMSDDSKYEWGGYSEIDIDSVDLKEFPKIKDVHYSKVRMNKGDCIFMPGGYWHQVRSWGYMNSAVSIWFSQLKQFAEKDCDEGNISFTPMNEVMVLWRYSGYGDLSQGHMDIYILKRFLLTLADNEGKIWLKEFVQKYFQSESRRKDVMRKDEQERAKKLVEYLDHDHKGFVTHGYIENLTIHQLKELLLFIDPNDVSNTEDFEYSHIHAPYIEDLVAKCHDKRGIFDKERFISSYVQGLGGTPTKAAEIVESLGAHNKDTAVADTEGRISKVLHKFYSAKEHDPTFERKMYQHLRQHDEL